MLSKKAICAILVGPIVWVGLPLTALNSAVLAQSSSACEGGKLPQEHRLGGYSNFITNSTVIEDSASHLEGPGKPYKYVTCVKNLDHKSDLWVDWYVPGPHTWVPPLQNVDAVPRWTLTADTTPLEGCLEYGNLAAKTKATFLGDHVDRERVEKEADLDCLRTSERLNREGIRQKIYKLFTPFRLFFPSDLSKPKDTMLVMDGVIYLMGGSAGWRSEVDYKVSQYEGRPDGKPSNVRVRPIFRDDARDLTQAFAKANKLIRQLDDNGTIEFTFQTTGVPSLSYATYEFIDYDARRLAALDFPVFISTSSP